MVSPKPSSRLNAYSRTVSERVRAAVIGLGRMGAVHMAALREVPEIDVVAIADTRESVLDAAAHDHPHAAIHADPATVLAASGVEAVLLATPTPTHPVLTAAALEAGKHVLCEKPLALDPAVSESLGSRASAQNLILQVGYWRRFSAPWVAARDTLATGRIGDPVLLRLSQWDADPPPPEFCDPAVSGGLAVDCGVHEFDLATWLTGRRPLAVFAHQLPGADPAIAAAGDVENLLVTVDLTGGAKVIVDLSRNARYGDDVRSEILGTDGALFVDTLPAARTRIGDGNGLTMLEGSQVDNAMLAGVQAQATAFAHAIRAGDERYPDAFADAGAVQVANAAMESLRTGDSVRISS